MNFVTFTEHHGALAMIVLGTLLILFATLGDWR